MISEQRVLLIDHSGTALALITKLIQKNIPGTIVDVAHTPEEARDQLGRNKYRLITMSRNLPGTDCHELLKQIRMDMGIKRTPLIVVSGENVGLFEDSMSCELVNGYFDKKLGQDKLVGYIRSFLYEGMPDTRVLGHILYVEDSPTISRVICEILDRHGHNHILARNAEQALQHLNQSLTGNEIAPFDLVLTDIQLDGHMSGRDLIREIRYGMGLNHDQLPILVTTSSNYDADPMGLNRIFSAGANDILEKPVREPMLVARLNNLLKSRQQYLHINQEHGYQAAITK